MKQLLTGWLAALLCCAIAHGADWRMPSALGDARRGVWTQADGMPVVSLTVDNIPPGVHSGLTVIAWMRITSWDNDSALTTYASWCPYPVDRFRPDKLAGAGGYGGGDEIDLTALGGAKAFPGVVFSPYDVPEVPLLETRYWPNGVATVAGESEQAITVSAGGADVMVGPGEFNQNVIAGPSGGVVISGAGKCRVGVSQTPLYQFFDKMDGVIAEGGGMTDESMVTNTWAMCSYRWALAPGGAQIYRSDLGRLHAFDDLALTSTNHTGVVTSYDSRGIYKVGLAGYFMFEGTPSFDIEIFDVRTFPRWLSQAEMERIHANGVQEILRRWPGGE